MKYIQRGRNKSQQTAKPSKYPQGYFKDKTCRDSVCKNIFSPKAPSEHYCSDSCRNRGVQSKYLMRVYGISVDDYENMLEEQEGLCKICNTEGFIMDKARHKIKLVVDHCHTTGEVRGLLCHNCNRALGLLQDDVSNFNRAIEYLERATTIPTGSTSEAYADGSAQPLTGNAEGEDIV